MPDVGFSLKRCVWIEPGEKKTITGFDKIFIGSEVCGKFLSSADIIREIEAYRTSGYETGIISPYLTPNREIEFTAFLEKLTNVTEVIVNDVGAYKRVRDSKHIPILGRLLMRQNTDPAIRSFYQDQPDRVVYDYTDRVNLRHMNPPAELTKHFTGSPVFSEETADFFRDGDDELQVMMDLLPHGFPGKIPGKIRVLLNTDNILVSVFPCRSCDDCPQNEIILGKTRANIPIYRKKNLCYYKYAEINEADKITRFPDYVSGTIVGLS